jgi:hypothetical protein
MARKEPSRLMMNQELGLMRVRHDNATGARKAPPRGKHGLERLSYSLPIFANVRLVLPRSRTSAPLARSLR